MLGRSQYSSVLHPGTLRAYVAMLRTEDGLYLQPFYAKERLSAWTQLNSLSCKVV
jgi:hypothetical protein